MKDRTENEFTVELLCGLLMSILAGFMISALLAVMVMFLPGLARTAEAADIVDRDMLRKNEVTRGSVLLQTESKGLYRMAPLVKTDVHMRVNGMLVRTRVVQRFKNPGQEWQEGIYVFPLPDKAAVDHLRMHIGDRVINGVIKQRQEAKKIYHRAKQAGQKASLIEQERANIFTTSIANIGPGETVSIEIEYQQTLKLDKEHFRLRFPLVVAPRYIPGTVPNVEEQVQGFSGSGWARNTNQVLDASRITPPVISPGHGPLNPVTLRVDLNAGFQIDKIQSSYHRISQEVQSATSMTLTLADKQVVADRDFELVWKPKSGHVPRAALFSERKGQHNYLMLMLMPPDKQQIAQQVLDREIIYVIDTSGSMGGASIRQARRALQYAIRELKPTDYFNVIQFNSKTSRLYQQSVPADQVHMDEALDYVRSLQASGGTEMASALHAALELASDNETGRLRQVVFLTDGSIGNEEALFSIIKDKLGDSRLFTVGIGSAPNSHFMHKAAQFGRGTYTYIGKIQEVDEKMSALFRKIQMPVLSDLKVEWPEHTEVEMWPARLPDLYAGEPIILSARLSAQQGTVRLSGKRSQQRWQTDVTLDTEQQSSGVAVLWAREKIADLMDRLRDGSSVDVIKKGVTDLALEHHLVSRYTSLVAVDETPVRSISEKLVTKAVKVSLPAGWQHNKVFSNLPQTAAGSYRDLILGMLLTLLGCLLSVYFHRKNTHAA